MNHPWGLSGPDFLRLYAAGLVLAMAWAAMVRLRVRRPRLAEPPPPPDLAELAYLAGGSRRLAELAIARLIESGNVRTNRKGTLTVASTRGVRDPLDRAVLAAIGRRSIRAATLLQRFRAAEQADEVGTNLALRGLLLTPDAVTAARRHAVLALYALLAVGIVRLVNGLAEGLPVGYLAVLLGLTAVAAVVLHRRPIRPVTVHGEHAVNTARPGITAGVAMVALGGLAAFPDEQIRDVLVSSAGTGGSGWSYSGGGGYGGCSTGSPSGSDGGGGGSSCGGGGCGGGGD